MSELYLVKMPGWYRARHALAALRRQQVPPPAYASKKKLNLGSGDRPLPTYVNVDALAQFAPDIVSNVAKLNFAGDGEYDLIRASHVLEHFAYPNCMDVLREWRRALKVGGHLVVCVPDFETLSWRTILKPSGLNLESRVYQNGWINGLFALDLPPEFRHQTVFTYSSLSKILTECGFRVVGQLNYMVEEPYIMSIEDDSTNYFSLNVAAIKL